MRFEPQEGVLVLSNGQTLAGKITRAGDRYYVALESGAINLSSQHVVLQCRDLQEAYERQRDARIQPRVHDHLKLANWCIQNKMPREARVELDAASACEPNHPKIAVLRRRLELEQQPAPDRPATAPAAAPVQPQELERLVRSMPPGTMEGFANTVQPLLLNHCATAACHGAQAKNSFKLVRGAGGAPPSRRVTQRNLHQLLAFIDRDNPSESRVLEAAGEAHGATQTPILKGRDSEQFRQLAQWVSQVSRETPAVEPGVLPIPSHELVRQLPAELRTAGKPAPPGTVDPARYDARLTRQWSKTEGGDDEFRVAADGSILTNLPD
ncbi:MAG: hypothetical protein JNG90_01285, partial [Planctomycetaceae bacterium]|nr:hypothetical protein [Planctomycetaceae bacterium]